jgi:hypothetical protein
MMLVTRESPAQKSPLGLDAGQVKVLVDALLSRDEHGVSRGAEGTLTRSPELGRWQPKLRSGRWWRQTSFWRLCLTGTGGGQRNGIEREREWSKNEGGAQVKREWT